MTPASPPIVIAGGGVGSWRTAHQLRLHGFAGPITLISAESGTRHNRPPLSKQILLGKLTADDISLLWQDEIAQLDIRVRSGVRVAMGDIAAWPDPRVANRRIEHWERATEHARVVAARISGRPTGELLAPYFWSDQFGIKIQMAGWSYMADSERTFESPTGEQLHLYLAGDLVVSAMVASSPRLFAQARRPVSRRLPVDQFIKEVGVTRVDRFILDPRADRMLTTIEQAL